MNKLLSLFLFFGLIASVVLSVKIDLAYVREQPNLQDIPLCLVCSFAVDQAEKYLEKHANNTVIIDSVEKDCDLLKDASWISKCQEIVSDYGLEIIQLLENKESPEAVCAAIHLCGL